jgi:hypothetical protein
MKLAYDREVGPMIQPNQASRCFALLLFLLAVPACRTMPADAQPALPGELMTRTELFFGMSRPNGPDVSEAEFQAFLEEEVTPRFPQGYTVMNAEGKWLDMETGKTIKELTRLLVLIYPSSDGSAADIEAIRNAYKMRFNQQAVLRIDDTNVASF